MSKLKNPDTGETIEMDLNAIQELTIICEKALELTPVEKEITFRGMRIELSTAIRIAEEKF